VWILIVQTIEPVLLRRQSMLDLRLICVVQILPKLAKIHFIVARMLASLLFMAEVNMTTTFTFHVLKTVTTNIRYVLNFVNVIIKALTE
jgi:hypothetical protein